MSLFKLYLITDANFFRLIIPSILMTRLFLNRPCLTCSFGLYSLLPFKPLANPWWDFVLIHSVCVVKYPYLSLALVVNTKCIFIRQLDSDVIELN